MCVTLLMRREEEREGGTQEIGSVNSKKNGNSLIPERGIQFRFVGFNRTETEYTFGL